MSALCLYVFVFVFGNTYYGISRAKQKLEKFHMHFFIQVSYLVHLSLTYFVLPYVIQQKLEDLLSSIPDYSYLNNHKKVQQKLEDLLSSIPDYSYLNNHKKYSSNLRTCSPLYRIILGPRSLVIQNQIPIFY